MTTISSPTAIPYRPVRQREIAEHAGVSVSTVSRVLSGSAGIGPSARARVLEAATQLGHPLSNQVGGLRHVGLFVSNWRSLPTSQPSAFFHADILAGAEAECRARGIQLRYTVIDRQSDSESLIRERVERRHLDGLLFFELDDQTLLERILRFALPVVVINAEHPGIPVDIVVPDNEGGAYLAANHLIDNGHRRILNIAQVQRPTRARRARAFQTAVAAGLGENPNLMLVPKHNWETAGEMLLERLNAKAADFTAVFCWDDTVAVHVIRALHSKGYDVPRDISVIGFNDLPFAALLSPALTTVRIEGGELGRVAIRRLVERAQTPCLTPVQVNVATRLIERQSVAPVTAKR